MQLSKSIIVILALIACLAWSALCYDNLDTPIQVSGGDGVNQFLFDLGNNQHIELDIVSPTVDFSFSFSNSASSNNSEKMAFKDTPIEFFTLKIEDEASVPSLDFGANIRFIYNDGLFSVSPSSLVWLEFRSDKWRQFPDDSVVTTMTKTISQSFSRDDLRPGQTELAVYGGNTVTFPSDDYDYDLYTRYNVALSVQKSIANKFSFAMPARNEVFELEIMGADRNFEIKVERSETNPHSSSSFPTGTNKGLYFFTITNSNNAKPVYNVVYRYKYISLPSSISVDSLNFAHYSSNSYVLFSQEASKDTKVITQSASTIDDGISVVTELAIVGKESSTPSPSPSSSNPPPASSSPASSPASSPSASQGGRNSEHSNNSNVIQVKPLFMLVVVAFLGLVHLYVM